jgi:hypothetical protein
VLAVTAMVIIIGGEFVTIHKNIGKSIHLFLTVEINFG